MDGVQSAIDAAKSHRNQPVDAHVIMCLVRNLGELSAAAALVRALPYLANITAIGLASTEVGYPPQDFRDVYRAASLLGLHRVAHAGEEGGPDYVWAALRVLGVQRVDHGIRSIEDPELVSYMINKRVPITLCPLSNLALKVYDGQLQQKLRDVMSSGLTVTLNSDDPAYFSGYLNENYEYMASVVGLGPEALAQLAKNSFTASFIPQADKQVAHAAVDAALKAWRAEQQPSAAASPVM
jgi:adenosine deaminase